MAKNCMNYQHKKRHKHILRDEFLAPLSTNPDSARKALEKAKQYAKDHRHE